MILILWLISPVLLLLVADSFGLSSLPNSAPTIWGWIECSNPYYLAFAPYSDPGKVGLMTYLGFLAICLFLSALLLSLATLRIRGVALTQAGRSSGRLSTRPVLPALSHTFMVAVASRPVARRQPGLVA